MITIKLATNDELKTLQILSKELFNDNYQYDHDLIIEYPDSEAGEKYFNGFLNNPDACALIAWDDTTPIGYLVAESKKIDYRKSKYLEIGNISVNPDYRSQGIGKQLIDKCITWAKAKGFQRVYVSSYFANNKAVAFYKKNGFVEIDVGLEITL